MLDWWRRRKIGSEVGGPLYDAAQGKHGGGQTITLVAQTINVVADGTSKGLEISALRQLSVVEVPSALTQSLRQQQKQQQPPLHQFDALAPGALSSSKPAGGANPLQPSSSSPDRIAAVVPLQHPQQQQQQTNQSLVVRPLSALSTSPRKFHTSLPMSRLIHSAASLSRAGRDMRGRKTNQDSCFAFKQYLAESQALMGVLDGHGPLGHHASAFLKQHLPVALVDELGQAAAPVPPAATDPGPARATLAAEALTTCFLDADAALGKSVDCQYSGSTAVVSLLEGRRLTTAWVGDSRAVLVRQEQWGLRGLALTRDHKPTGTEERARILAAGGRVDRLSDSRGQPVGPARVWLGESWVPGLAMSRALGDIVAHSAGVSSHPDVSVMEVTPQDRFLILASDGVWEFMDCQAAADLVAGCTSAEEACRTLVNTAWNLWMQEDEVVDDITVVAIKFNAI